MPVEVADGAQNDALPEASANKASIGHKKKIPQINIEGYNNAFLSVSMYMFSYLED